MDHMHPWDVTDLLRIEELMHVHSSNDWGRELAQKRLEGSTLFSPQALAWFDLRWPEESGDAP